MPQPAAHPAARRSLEQDRLGLFPAQSFRLVPGDCDDCDLPEAVLWWFRDTLIAVPAHRSSSARDDDTNARDARLDADVHQGARAAPALRETMPPVVWIEAPQVVEHARLSADARQLQAGGAAFELELMVTWPVPGDAHHIDAATATFFADRPLRVRGTVHRTRDGSRFAATTLWPEDARLDARTITLEPLARNRSLGTLIEAQTSERPFTARALYEREPGAARRLAGRPVLAFVLSGAQSDDDASRAGHLAVATGVFGLDGEWHDWIVNNFYPLVRRNAKGIISAPVPMDDYLLALDSGQLYYRPGYMLVAVLRRPRAAREAQAALQETMVRYYCREFEFGLASHNSTAMTIDPLREIGWRIPPAGRTSRAAGLLAAPFAALAGTETFGAKQAYAAFATEKTRLLPRVAFEVAGHDLLALAEADREADGKAEPTPFERMLMEDLESILFVRLPQVPTNRPTGTYPAPSLLSYGTWLLANPEPFESAPSAGRREAPDRLAGTCRAEEHDGR